MSFRDAHVHQAAHGIASRILQMLQGTTREKVLRVFQAEQERPLLPVGVVNAKSVQKGARRMTDWVMTHMIRRRALSSIGMWAVSLNVTMIQAPRNVHPLQGYG